ncbi:hypothetical protein DH2020_014606 [Rehmannia glutinosa]|uniref:Myb/SANT-like domain-containing protein n=1 Tax=Rehmannia glutinosa TaxID=99300 RepID=A0ABR0WXE0_REHGL
MAFENAYWPEANVTAFIMIIHDEVTQGNINTAANITPSKWTDIISEVLFACRGYNYSVKQLKGKFTRIKAKWKKYNTLLISDSGFRWDDANDMANPNDSILRRKSCPHYRELTTIFAPHEDGLLGRFNDEGFGETVPLSPAVISAEYSCEMDNEMVELELDPETMATIDMCMQKLMEMPDLPPDIYCTACRKFEKPVCRRIFLAMKPELRRDYIESL